MSRKSLSPSHGYGLRKAAACSPITTHRAIVLPVVTRGMIDASAM